ncbi:heterokaryon incompatibility protein-domain-containing protein [Xylariaceae sp. AK1471]|nr:heterokaryon incompatibility protein-domain-containing protein [Xylariaceae sp. AK1471]
MTGSSVLTGPSNDIQQAVCSHCEQLDTILASLDDVSVPEYGKPVLSLGKRSRRTGCNMCRFFLDLNPNYNKDYKLHVRLFDHIKDFSLSPRYPTLTNLPRSRFLSVLRDNKRLVYDMSIEDEITQPGVTIYLPIDTSSLTPPPVRSVSSAAVDFKLLASLITDCQKSHALCTPLESRHMTYIYLINCVEETVVREHPSKTYLALSYVWGSNSQACSQFASRGEWPKDSFSFNEAPLTVQDAIRVVRNLGRKYLWVDKYCINQRDGAEKQMMLQNMDQIYENAEATIVAMSGDNDGAGLPGVSGQSRISQPYFPTARGCFISSFPPIATVVQRSKWATRGWTYQEARLSRRCLFFTEYQVYIVCRETTRSEAVPSESQSCQISSLLNSSRLNAALFGQQSSIANGFWRDRLAYTQRTLTYESDILNGFRGILNRSPFVSFWGIPITPPKAAMDAHTGLSLGLLWTRTPSWAISTHLKSFKEGLRTRRPDFPTWSWTSVTGSTFNDGYGENSVFGKYLNSDDSVSHRSDAYIRFWIYAGDEQVPLHEVMQQQLSIVLPENYPFLLVEGDLVRVTPKRKNMYRVWGCEHLSLEFAASYDLDEDMAADLSQAGDRSSTEDALILVDWNDSQRKTKKRFVLMLLRWIQDGLAERKGLLSEYRLEHDAEALEQIPRTRKKFILQ